MIEQIKGLPLSEEDLSFIQAIEKQANNKKLTLGFFGSFSVGKSALINQLVGEANLLPTHTNETTAIPTFITGADEDVVLARKFDGEEFILSLEELHTITAGKITEEIESIHIQRSTPNWLKDIVFIDTPGRNTKFQAHIDASEQALITSDAIVYVLPWQGLTLEDIVYIKHILRYQPNLYFILNKTDRIDESQGVSIAELQKDIEEKLFEQLGKNFKVYATSALTGYNKELLFEDLIEPLKFQVKSLKESRLQYALEEFLKREQLRVSQQITLFEEVLLLDHDSFESKKAAIQIQYETVNTAVVNNMVELREKIDQIESEMNSYILKSYLKLELAIQQLVKEDLAIEELTLKLENEIVTTRNEVFDVLRKKLQQTTDEEIQFALTDLGDAKIDFKVTPPNIEEIQEKYQGEREELLNEISTIQNELDAIPQDSEENQAKRQQLEFEIAKLTEKVVEEFVPKYKEDGNFDPNKATKIASAIGLAGDMALTVTLAVMTSGGSAAVQAGGKAAAKATVTGAVKGSTKVSLKESTKVIVKKAALEVAEKAVIASATSKQKNKKEKEQESTPEKDSGLVIAAKALDKFTSPVQTVAQKIGESIDGSRKQNKKEDQNYRKDFYAQKMMLEEQRDEKLYQLKKLEDSVQSDAKIIEQLKDKRLKVEQSMDSQLKQLEKKYNEEVAHLEVVTKQKQINEQIDQILVTEKEELNLWFTNEFATIINAIETMVPKQLQSELSEWEKEIAQIEQLKTHDIEKITEELNSYHQIMQSIDSIINGEVNAVL